jgi:hypothetical protein
MDTIIFFNDKLKNIDFQMKEYIYICLIDNIALIEMIEDAPTLRSFIIIIY